MGPMFTIDRFVVLPDTSIVFEEKETGILQRYSLKEKKLTNFQCKEIDPSLTLDCSGLYISGEILYHARGGKIKKYDICSSSRPRARILEDYEENKVLSSFCLHEGLHYFSKQSKLFRVGYLGSCHAVELGGLEFSCIGSSRRGLLLCGNRGISIYNPTTRASQSLRSPMFEDPTQIIELSSSLCILEKRGICILQNNSCKFYSLANVTCIAVYASRLLYLKENKIFFLDALDSKLEMNDD